MTFSCPRHMEKQETEMKLEMETGNRNQKLKTEMEMQLLRCCSPSKILLLLFGVLSLPPDFALLG